MRCNRDYRLKGDCIMDEIKEQAVKILYENVEELKGVEINDNTELISGGYIDSFDIVNVIGVFEEVFGIYIDLENIDLEEFNTVPTICGVLRKAGLK